MEAVIKHLVETAQVKVEGDKPEGEEAAAADGEAAEGGEEGDAAAAKEEGAGGDKPPLPSFNPYESLDLSEMKELGKFPELILGMSVKHPYFGDIMKA